MATFGALTVEPALSRPDLLAEPVVSAIRALADPALVLVGEIDPALADTAAFCARYDVTAQDSGNCVVVLARRGEESRFAACVVAASTRADVNGFVRRHLQARKASFAPLEMAVAETGMAYGGITPVGLPAGWPVLVDAALAVRPMVVVGSGVRHSKLVLPGAVLAALPGVQVVEGLGLPVA